MRTSTPLPRDYRTGTLADLFFEGLNMERPDPYTIRGDDGWSRVPLAEVKRLVQAVATRLRELGFQPGDRIAIMSTTRLEWALADWGVITSRTVSVPVYPILPADQVKHVLADSGASAVFVEDEEKLALLASIAPDLPELRLAVLFDGSPRAALGDEKVSFGAVTMDELIARGEQNGQELADSWEEFARDTDPGDLATIIYTSGTTGLPKGVMLTHANVHSNAALAARPVGLGPEDTALALLPMAHVFERVGGHFVMWLAGNRIAYAEAPETVVRDMGEVRPTVMIAVPRVFEKVVEGAEAKARAGGSAKYGIFKWARDVGERRAKMKLADEKPGAWLNLQYAVADKLVFSKLRALTGGHIRTFVSGGAPLRADVAHFLFAAGLPVLEGYGLTETSPVLTLNPEDRPRVGTVGLAAPGTKLKIADDGEILARGPQIMRGYYQNPEATAEAIDSDGWFATGDIGTIDEDGYLRITDRKKEIIVNAYGKNIAPQPVEAMLKRHSLIEEAVLIGDQRKFAAVLVVPEMAALRAASDVPAGTSDAELLASEATQAVLEAAVEAAVADAARHEKPRAVLLVPGPFGVDTGELTPTLKVKRRVIMARFGDQIDELYAQAESEAEAAET